MRTATDAEIRRARVVADMARDAAREIEAHADTVAAAADRVFSALERELADLDALFGKVDDDRTA